MRIYFQLVDYIIFHTMIPLRQLALLQTAVTAVLFTLVSTATFAQSSAEPENSWTGSAEPYLHIPFKQFTTVTVNDFHARTQLPPKDLYSLLQFIGNVRGHIERGRVGLMIDGAYLRVAGQASRNIAGGLFTGVGNITASMGVYDAAVRYRFGKHELDDSQAGSGTLITYAGVRIIDLWSAVVSEITGPFGYDSKDQGEVDRTWAQPLIGVSGSLVVVPNLRVFARADAGGFGLSGLQDYTGNAQLGLAYALCPSLRTNVSWRYRQLAWKSWELPRNGLTNDQNGIEVGLKFLF